MADQGPAKSQQAQQRGVGGGFGAGGRREARGRVEENVRRLLLVPSFFFFFRRRWSADCPFLGPSSARKEAPGGGVADDHSRAHQPAQTHPQLPRRADLEAGPRHPERAFVFHALQQNVRGAFVAAPARSLRAREPLRARLRPRDQTHPHAHAGAPRVNLDHYRGRRVRVPSGVGGVTRASALVKPAQRVWVRGADGGLEPRLSMEAAAAN
mmetsp:Transcript_50725/g.94295  ORF Transcript_50725/g.94295 Transcript_50725/m.94295 type:complete len:211 (+) Transcript_50725:288-920(+)